MGWRSRLAALGLVLAAVPHTSCRLHYARVEVGGTWLPADAEALDPSSTDRADVLRALGPPDTVTYTLQEEVLLYRRAGHRGSELRLLIPDPTLNLGRPGLESIGPGVGVSEELESTAPQIRIIRALTEGLFGALNPAASEEALALFSRGLRWDVVRVVLNRATHATVSVEIFRGIGSADASKLAREALLLEES